MKYCILYKFLVYTHNRFFYFIKLVDENENIYKKETWNIHESKQNMSEVFCYHMVWSVSLPQDPAEGISKVIAVLLGNGGTLGDRALGGKEHTGRVQLKDYWYSVLFLSLLSGCQEVRSVSPLSAFIMSALLWV